MNRLLAYLCAGALFAAGCSSGSSQGGREESPPETSAPKIEIVQDKINILEEVINFNLLDFEENKTIQ